MKHSLALSVCLVVSMSMADSASAPIDPGQTLVGITSRLLLVELSEDETVKLVSTDEFDEKMKAVTRNVLERGALRLASFDADPDEDTKILAESALKEIFRCNSRLMGDGPGACISSELSLETKLSRVPKGAAFDRRVTLTITPGSAPPAWLPKEGWRFERTLHPGKWSIVGGARLGGKNRLIMVVSRIYRIEDKG